MRELLSAIETWLGEGQEVARAVVARTYGSSPRREGAVMILGGDGRIEGSVSGGCVEGATAEYLADARASGKQRVVRFGISDREAWDVGLACGGTIDVLVQPAIPAAALEAARATASGRGASRAVVTALPEGSPGVAIGASETGPAAPVGEPLVVHADGRLEGSLGDEAADAKLVSEARRLLLRDTSGVVELAGRQLLVETYAARPRLVIVGAVAVAASLVRLARQLGYETIVIDARPAFLTPERFPEAHRLVDGWPDEVAVDIGLGEEDAVAVLSHDPKIDEPAVAEALRRGCRYVGVIGSRATQRARRQRLLELGLSQGQLDRLRGPIGLDLGGREPAQTALAILAEIEAARYEGSGRPLSALVAEREAR